MRIRSPRLLALSVALLATGGILGVLLQHDGRAIDTAELMEAERGDEVVLQADMERLNRDQWRELGGFPLDNHTYTVDRTDQFWIVATSPVALPLDAPIVLHAVVQMEAPLPDGRHLVVLAVEDAGEPLLFR